MAYFRRAFSSAVTVRNDSIDWMKLAIENNTLAMKKTDLAMRQTNLAMKQTNLAMKKTNDVLDAERRYHQSRMDSRDQQLLRLKNNFNLKGALGVFYYFFI